MQRARSSLYAHLYVLLKSEIHRSSNVMHCHNHFLPRAVMTRLARQSWMRTTMATTRLLNGLGNFLTPAVSLEEPHTLVVNKISRNLTLPLGSAAFAGASTLRAMGAHS